MGKARIISGGTEGLYTIEILEDRTRAETNRTTDVTRVASLDTRISELATDLSSAQSDVDTAAAAQDQAITDYQTALDDPELAAEDARQAMVKAGEAVIQAAAKRDAIARNIGALKSERLAIQRRIDLIDALPSLRQVSAWCADYTEDLVGEVATAEVPGEIGQVIIRPGFEGAEAAGWPAHLQGGAAWTAEQDGAIQPALSGTPASVFYNLSMKPGWQKWRPTFRFATIGDLDFAGDTCSVTLQPATSSQQALSVNPQVNYTGVPVTYMSCNASAFEHGDTVVVMFDGQNPEKPRVIGFASEPKQCATEIWLAFRDVRYEGAHSITEEPLADYIAQGGGAYYAISPTQGIVVDTKHEQIWQDEIEKWDSYSEASRTVWKPRCAIVDLAPENGASLIQPGKTSPVDVIGPAIDKARYENGDQVLDFTPAELQGWVQSREGADRQPDLILTIHYTFSIASGDAWRLMINDFWNAYGDQYKSLTLRVIDGTIPPASYPIGFGSRILRWVMPETLSNGFVGLEIDTYLRVTYEYQWTSQLTGFKTYERTSAEDDIYTWDD